MGIRARYFLVGCMTGMAIVFAIIWPFDLWTYAAIAFVLLAIMTVAWADAHWGSGRIKHKKG